MERLSDFLDVSMFPTLDGELVDEVLAGGGRSVSELLMLYFACITSDPDEVEFGDGPARIAQLISDLADDGDEEAMMAQIALDTVENDEVSEEAVIVGAAMMQAVASRPILRNVLSGDMDFDAAAPALMVIKMLVDHLVGDLFDLDELGDVDLDDMDLDDMDLDDLNRALMLDPDHDFDGDFDDRR